VHSVVRPPPQRFTERDGAIAFCMMVREYVTVLLRNRDNYFATRNLGGSNMCPDRRSTCRVLHTILVSLGAIVAACNGTSAPPPIDAAVPVLSVPIVDLALLNDFLPFGASRTPGRLNPTYELRTTGDTAFVRAAGPGTVINILANPEADSEIHIRPSGAANYLIIYDHVVSLQIVMGQSVAAGQVLGRIGPWVPGVGRIELQVNRGSGQIAVALCPRDFGTADFNAAHDAAFGRFPARGAKVCVASSVQP